MNRFSRAIVTGFALAASVLAPLQAQAAAIKPIGINPSTGQQQQIGAGNTIQAPAPTTSNASINLPHGSAPSSPVNGDCWTTTAGLYCQINGATVGPLGGSGAAVTSVGLSLPAQFTVSGSPVTSSGTLTATWATESANLVFAGPGSGSAAAPSFRALVAGDLPLATTSAFGAVKPDGSTITISGGVISAAGGGGGTTTNYYGGALQLIQTQTLSAAASSVNFSSIPQGYTDLVLVQNARGDTAASSTQLKVQFNGDSGADYDYQYVAGNNTTASAAGSLAQTALVIGDMPAATAPAGIGTGNELTIFSYSGTALQKTTQSVDSIKNGTSTGNTYAIPFSGWWRSTSAITSLSAFPAAGNFAAGSTFSLYGRGGNVTVNPQPGLPVICEVVTSGSATSVTVGGGSGPCPTIPSTFRDLKIVVSGRSTTSGTGTTATLLRLNGDTGANYTLQHMWSSGTSQAAGQSTSATSLQVGELANAGDIANYQSTSETTIQNYAGVTFAKSVLGGYGMMTNTGTSSLFVQTLTGTWSNTSAIAQLTIFPAANAFVDGSVITVYGIGGSATATIPVVPPQGRLTLTSNTPVMTADATAQTTLYYTPYVGSLLPVGNVMYRFSQLSFALNTTAHASGSLYDVFAYNNAGAINLCTGPAWTSSTARSAAISQDAVNGIWENTASLTCTLTSSTTTTTIAAAQATYLGTFYATANGQTGVAVLPAAAANGSSPIMGLWNAYNRVKVTVVEGDSTASWSPTNNSTWQTLHSSTSNRVSYVDGLQLVRPEAKLMVLASGTGDKLIGVRCDATSGAPRNAGQEQGILTTLTVVDSCAPGLGFHYLQAMEWSDSAIGSYIGTSASAQTQALQVTLENHLPLLLPLYRRRRRRAANDDAGERLAA